MCVDLPEGAHLLSGSWDGTSRVLESKRFFPALMCLLLQGPHSDTYRNSAFDQIHLRSLKPAAAFHMASYLFDCMVDMEITKTGGSGRQFRSSQRLAYS